MSKVTEGLIYERVNDTVYARDPSQPDKERWIVSGGPQSNPDWYIDPYDFDLINEMAKDGNKTLQNLLKEVKLVFELSYTDD